MRHGAAPADGDLRPRGRGGAGPRWLVLVLLVLPLSVMVGTADQRQAVAFVPAPVLVPAVVAGIALDAAGVACGVSTTCRGAFAGAAVDIGKCLFFAVFDCEMPWKQGEDRPPNGDVTPPGQVYCREGGSLQFGAQIGGEFTRGCPQPGQVSMVRTTSPANVATKATGADGSVSWGLAVPLGAGGAATGSKPTARGERVDYYVCAEAWVRAPTGCSAVAFWHYDSDPSFDPDPLRTGQPFSRCTDGVSVVTVAGPVAQWRESTADRPALTFPACPGSHPTRLGGGVAHGSPWTPGAVEGIPGTAGDPFSFPALPPGVVPVAPPVGLPQSPDLPLRPDPLAPPSWSPTPTPAGEPTPVPGTGPLPPPRPHPCMWGGYVVPADECDPGTDPTRPSPAPSTVPTAPPTGAPTEPPYPRPTPETTPAPEGEGCLGAGVTLNPTTWVFTPVRCALVWAFVPKHSALQRAQDVAGKVGKAAPFSYLTGTVGWVSGLGQASQCFTLNVATSDGPVRVLSTCQPGAFERGLQGHRDLLTVAIYAGFFIPMAWWAWRQYAPGSQGVS